MNKHNKTQMIPKWIKIGFLSQSNSVNKTRLILLFKACLCQFFPYSIYISYFCLKVVKHLYMAEAVTTPVQTTVNTGDVTYNMDHVFSATLDGWGNFAIQVRAIIT